MLTPEQLARLRTMIDDRYEALSAEIHQDAARSRDETYGELAGPVEEITIAGNLGDMLRDVDAVGSDLVWLGRVASPSLRIARMTVAGA